MSASGEPFSGKVIIYETPEGEARVDVRLERETVWLTQRQMAELFDTSTDNVGLHLKNVFDEDELVEAATTEDYSVVQAEGRRHVRRRIRHYNLDAIISVGYRVNSKRGTRQVVLAQRLRDARHGGDAGDGASAWSGIAAEHIDNKPHRGVLAHRFRDAKIR